VQIANSENYIEFRNSVTENMKKKRRKKMSKICWKNIVLSKFKKQFTAVLTQFITIENTVLLKQQLENIVWQFRKTVKYSKILLLEKQLYTLEKIYT
jgi:hypothetical protein